jgi:predicted DNA-binding protein (UPF0251 family)
MIEYLTVEQAAERMQVSCKTMYGLFRARRAIRAEREKR